MPIDYLSADSAPLIDIASGKRMLDLLWGDRVTVLGTSGDQTRVRARGKEGLVESAALGGESLLEVYFIDVGQGDGVLIRTPDHRHVVIDGGYKRAAQPTGKNAADFIDWKFAKDYGEATIRIDAMLASHNDADHYGGLWDLLDVDDEEELDAGAATVEAFYHAGIAWWKNPATGKRWLGGASADGEFFTQLMGDRAKVVAALKPDANPKLHGEWADLMTAVTKTKTGAGTATPIRRLSHTDEFVPGFEGGNGAPALRVLAPVEFVMDGKPAVRRFGAAEGQNTNGNSLLLRLDYGRARILLTGDLNRRSQNALLADYTGERQEFQCDVAKACHHGSDDVSYEFLSAMRPAVTVISSGDNEGHDHPRPAIVAASATTGYLQIEEDSIVTPLVYSTELARSVSFGRANKLTLPEADGQSQVVEGETLAKTKVQYKETKAGDLNPRTRTKEFRELPVVAGQVYGLVNVRTNGDRILVATMDEKDYSWQRKVFRSRF